MNNSSSTIPIEVIEVKKEIVEEEPKEANFTISDRSKSHYLHVYNTFKTWKHKKNINSSTEPVLLQYFHELADKYKTTTVESYYSMLKSTLYLYENVNIDLYPNLYRLLKNNKASKSKFTKVFTQEQIDKFITEASDFHLPIKVAVILGCIGGCRREDLYNMKLCNIKDLGSEYLVNVPATKHTSSRVFFLKDPYYKICKRYFRNRTENTNIYVFQQYLNGKILKQRMGVNAFRRMAKTVAGFLKLKNFNDYTALSFRKSAEVAINQQHREAITKEPNVMNNGTTCNFKPILPKPPTTQPTITNACPPPLQLIVVGENGEIVGVGKSGISETIANNLAKAWTEKLLKFLPQRQLQIVAQINQILNEEENNFSQVELKGDVTPAIDTSYDVHLNDFEFIKQEENSYNSDVKVNIDIEPTKIITRH